MAATTATNYTEVVNLVQPYVDAFFPEVLSFVNSGAMAVDTTTDISQGSTFTVRHRNGISTDWRAPVANTDTTIDNISGNNEKGVIWRRYKDLGIEDFAKLSSGDQMAVEGIARTVVHNYNRSLENTALDYVGGVFGSGGPLASTHVVDATGNAIKPSNVAQAKKKFGEYGAGFGFLFMHSDVFYDSEIQALTSPSAAEPDMLRIFNDSGMAYAGRYGGLRVILNDRLTNDGTTYDTYLMRPGALLLTYQMPPKYVAFYDPRLAGGTDVQGYRVAGSLHIPGLTWNTTDPSGVAGVLDADLATGSYWSKRTGLNDKEIGIVCIKSLATAA